jgi:hypothetical protein
MGNLGGEEVCSRDQSRFQAGGSEIIWRSPKQMGAVAEANALLREYVKLETDSGWREVTTAILQDK